MNTKELALKISAEYGVSYRQADRIIHTLIDEIKNSVAVGDPVRLAGLGSFCRVEREERTVKTPVGGEVTIPAHGAVKFSASSYWKEMLK